MTMKTRLENVETDIKETAREIRMQQEFKQVYIKQQKRLKLKANAVTTHPGASFHLIAHTENFNVGVPLPHVINARRLLDRLQANMKKNLVDLVVTLAVHTNHTFTIAKVTCGIHTGFGVAKRSVSDPVRPEVGASIATERALVDMLLKIPRLPSADKVYLDSRAMR